MESAVKRLRALGLRVVTEFEQCANSARSVVLTSQPPHRRHHKVSIWLQVLTDLVGAIRIDPFRIFALLCITFLSFSFRHLQKSRCLHRFEAMQNSSKQERVSSLKSWKALSLAVFRWCGRGFQQHLSLLVPGRVLESLCHVICEFEKVVCFLFNDLFKTEGDVAPYRNDASPVLERL